MSEAVAAADDPFLGRTVLGRYRIVRPIGRGGMGIIYLARLQGAARFVKPVVVKRAAPDLLAREPGLIEVMGREARIMSHLHDPSIVSVIDFAEEEGAYLLVLDYVHGYHLGQWHKYIRRKDRLFPTDLAIRIMCTVLDALHYAHTARGADDKPLGIVHRDVSPGNVLIDVDGNVKLADFGIARMHSDHTDQTTDKALLKGKFPYMAPELLSRGDPSPSSDVYAAGVVLHELLVGQNELKSDSIERTIARILHHIPSSVRLVRASAPDGLDDVIAQAVAKRPGDRFRDAAEFAQALRALPGAEGDEIDRKLTAAIAADFRNPEMSSTLGVPDLATLDRAWREPSEVVGIRVPVNNQESVTQVAPPSVPPNPLRKVAIAAAGVVGLAAVVGGVVLATRRSGTEGTGPAPVIVVNGQVNGADGLTLEGGAAAPAPAPAPASASASAPAPAPASAPASAASAHTLSPVARADGTDSLTRAFSRQQPQVARCFASNASDVAGSPEIAIRFGVDVSGHVTSAQVLPGAVASTPLGVCLAGVAQGTQFGPQAHDVSFRIPIVARRSQ